MKGCEFMKTVPFNTAELNDLQNILFLAKIEREQNIKELENGNDEEKEHKIKMNKQWIFTIDYLISKLH